MVKAKVDWQGEAAFLAVSGSGHKVLMDGPPDHGGKNLGPRPMEMILLGLGGCSSFDVMSILKKSRQDVTACVCEIEADRADAVPAVFTKIHLSFRVSGNDLKEALVKRAVQLSAEKHGHAALEAGGTKFPKEIKRLMTFFSKVMTKTTAKI